LPVLLVRETAIEPLTRFKPISRSRVFRNLEPFVSRLMQAQMA
jgi:hypothetical protein